MLEFRKLNKYYFTYLFVSFFPLIFSLFYQRQREEDFVFCLLSAFIFTFPIYFFKRPKFYFIFSSIILFISGLLDLVHIYLYQGRISSSIFFIILDTNPSESVEFFQSNVSLGLIFLILGYASAFILFARAALVQKGEFFKNWKKKRNLFFLIAPFLVKFLTSSFNVDKTLEAYTRSNQSFLLVSTYFDYKSHMKIFTEFSKKAKTVTGVKRPDNVADMKEIYILVIGESTTKNHMSLYGYKRKTTPFLDKRRKELLVFKDVANSYPPGTASNLKRINTFANFKNNSKEALSVSLTSIMKSAGFKTYWISNQLILGKHDTITTALAKQADVSIFTNTTNSITYDEKILPIFEKKLNEQGNKKFIVLHLIGTHMQYENRFPDNFKTFKGNTGLESRKYYNRKTIEYVNAYDNAILYHDHILNEILKITQASKNKIVNFVYFSDHGEEVYRDKNLHGHPTIGDTLSIYEIPFIIWSSKKYQHLFKEKWERVKNAIEKPFAHDDIIHGLLDIYSISYKKYEDHLNVFSEKFKPRKRRLDKIRHELKERNKDE